jgi:hypothetical protein
MGKKYQDFEDYLTKITGYKLRQYKTKFTGPNKTLGGALRVPRNNTQFKSRNKSDGMFIR